MAQHFYSSTATLSSLAAPAAQADVTLLVPQASFVGYPASYPYTIRLEGGTANEELVDVTGAPVVSGANYAVPVSRGVDGSAARTHAAGSVVDHPVVGRDLTEASSHVYGAVGVHGLPGTVRPLGSVGATQRQVDFGMATVTTDASGFATISHNLGRAPVGVVATPQGPSGGSPIFNSLILDTLTSTTFRIRAVSTTGAAIASTSVTLQYIAIG